ncbi:MAG: aconitate hydratase AcnA [Anaerolineales bacterium]|nr:aconitate hydratase AcnA [Chloroflexota bacterium]MBL6980760.1 aconitate hydratase AcnA [Anaerolineales bacterium]
MNNDYFNSKDVLKTSHGDYVFYRLEKLEDDGLTQLDRLPFSIRVMLESVLRQCDGVAITKADVVNLASWTPSTTKRPVLPFRPGRVVMQDFTGVPAVVDLAAMRSAMARLGGDPKKINPLVDVDLVIDHSVQVDFFGDSDALQRNAELEFQRNRERYEFLHWGQKAFDNFRVVPPATGIIHQVNLEYLADVVLTKDVNGERIAFPDSLVGTDSHTTMINGLGVVGWGVGGIEAEAAILGQQIDMLTPDVVGFNLFGQMQDGITATDLVLQIVQMLREKGVVGKFVEFYGPGLDVLSLPDRATIANMAPEYGATMGFFPVDDETLRYMRLTGRSEEVIERVDVYLKEQRLFRTSDTPDAEYTDTLALDLGSVEPNMAGPTLPHHRVPLSEMKETFQSVLRKPVAEHGYALDVGAVKTKISIGTNGSIEEMGHGAVVIAAITSCTNTSNPSVMIGAGLVAKKAVERGLQVKPYVKTSLAPGSRVVTEYLSQSKLLEPLAELGFNVVGFGCTTCIGNSGPLSSEIVRGINEADLVAAAVLSGNRNFEGRISPHVRANYLASPPLVVAYALAGTVNIDINNDPLGTGKDGQPVYLRDIWPSSDEITETISNNVTPEMFKRQYANVFEGNEIWNRIEGGGGDVYGWDEASTYIQEPPFFVDLTPEIPDIEEIKGARVLALLGDSITTDHISPAGAIPPNSAAGKYLIERGVKSRDFNSFGSRRGNDRVMTRGTFGNIRLKNQLVPGTEGSFTIHMPGDEKMSIFEASNKYKEAGTPLVVLAGTQYGTGSSRDWAAKGTFLLGVKAVIAASYERIHRSNLVGMGVLPLQFKEGQNAESLGLKGRETFDIIGLKDAIQPQSEVTVQATKEDGSLVEFVAVVRLDTAIEVEYYRNGGILHTVLRNMLTA